MAKKIKLNDYLGHSMDCTCGKEHKTNLKIVDIDKDAVSRLPKHIEALGYKKPFLVADVNTWAAAGALAAEKLDVAGIYYNKNIFNEKELIADVNTWDAAVTQVTKELDTANLPYIKYIFKDKELVPDEKTLGSLMMAFSRDCDVIVAVGSGTLNDLCKFSSFQLGLDYMVFATAPSMDGFVSIGAALITNYVKTTYQAHVPLAVIGDTDILAAAPMEMITAGLGDILGKYTCLLDWKMAHIITGEYYCSHIADMVKEAVEIVVEESTRIKDRNPDAGKAVTEALVFSGIAVSFVGNSRPASGSEHHLSHYWEMKFQAEGKKPILHGIKVGIGMIAVTKMYETLENEQFDFASLKERSFDYAAWEKKVKDCYQDAAPGIIALEEKAQKNNLDKRNKRLAILEEKWPEILRTIKESLPSSAEMEKLLASLGAPINPAQIGVSSELVEDAVILAKEVRDRFTLLQVLWDTGLLDEYAKMIAAYFGEKANC